MRVLLLLFLSVAVFAQKIDRKEVIERHKVYNYTLDTLSTLSVGNGHFAFTVDATGLQTFPAYYAKGIPLGTQSSWSWHSFSNPENFQRSETYRTENYAGRPMTYALQAHKNARKDAATDYFRANPHRIHLGHWGFRIMLSNGSLASLKDIKDIKQILNPYTGEIQSSFSVEGVPVKVFTFSDPQEDIIYTNVVSPLLVSGRLSFQLDFPFPSQQFLDEGVTDAFPEKHKSFLSDSLLQKVIFHHQIDSLLYPVTILANEAIKVRNLGAHMFEIKSNQSAQVEMAIGFGEVRFSKFMAARLKGRKEWEHYWTKGGMIDFGQVKDQRAKELERRMVLSMYLAKVQSSSNEPPQETGLVYNSWFGRPHLEMTWWHLMHFAYWNKGEYLEKVLPWYERNFKAAKELAQRQGLRGVRWQKMTDPDGGESPSSVGSFLLWQQPHIIDMLDVIAKRKPVSFQEKYHYLVEETAFAMEDLLSWDSLRNVYRLGPGFIPAQESLPFSTTYNAPLELAYWYQGLRIAQEWRKTIGKLPNKKWAHILSHFPALPEQAGIYQAAEGYGDTYKNPKFISDHPTVAGAMGMVEPLPSTDPIKMHATLQKIDKVWNWESTWGWDYPLLAMTALRLHDSERAVDYLLKPVQKNTYLNNGHNYQDKRLRLYMPGNGGLLSTLAWMAQGQIGNPSFSGFPQSWKVKIEGFK
ncbi:hypothetical protein ACMH5Q_04515 [Aquirufa lenticrescens]